MEAFICFMLASIDSLYQLPKWPNSFSLLKPDKHSIKSEFIIFHILNFITYSILQLKKHKLTPQQSPSQGPYFLEDSHFYIWGD